MAEHFLGVKDNFHGLTIDSTKQSFASDADFAEKLEGAIQEWKTSGVRGLWMKVAIAHSAFIPHAVKLGFVFHHAQPDYVMMCKWLPTDESNSLPEYATHCIGVAGFVLNADNKLLVIQERFFDKPHWKLPGGIADKGEDIPDTAKREVLEETGIECEFVSLICFRHMHNFRFGCSDLYFICLMRPISTQISRCEREIAKCQWMDLDEYIDHPLVSDANRHIARCYRNITTNNNFTIMPQDVLSYDKKGFNKIYSVYQLDP